MRQELENALAQLHKHLQDVQELDVEERARLEAAVTEIQTSLDRSEVNSQSLAERLQEATEEFKASHPALTENLGRIADMLSQMGI
ncbi:DUF4404 family protein [Rubripirellula amarantea]|uniref:Chromosome partition protein Smc n=1 Tax=Rubripirellula amarantea TaxID=2527999 RepID=A0A5C5WDK1_9BACT|nr:DUF4404 family protein [Rubripirellula amarantea]MDA8744870.1 DUF4404 family protein [Rubripirellula amarantea]TWT48171.1 hypothetical protein Pla22_51720 [Rubripirellula amarantea]